MDIFELEAIMFFSSHEGNDIKTIDELDSTNKILYVTLKDGRQGFIPFGLENTELYIEEEI